MRAALAVRLLACLLASSLGSCAPRRGPPEVGQAQGFSLPPSSGPAPVAEPLEVTLARYNLERVNAHRATHGRQPVAADPGLDAFARAASERLARDHAPHAHFLQSAARDPAFGHVSAENQGDPRGIPAMDVDSLSSGRRQIDAILDLMMAEGRGGGHFENLLNPAHRRAGIGLVLVGGALYLTNDFSD